MELAASSEMEDQAFTNTGIMFPSPNWFLPRVMAVGSDGWVVYGAMGRGICVIVPRGTGANGTNDLYISNRAHADRVLCVELSEEWSERRRFVSGSTDGLVKQWVLEEEGGAVRMRTINAHDAHKADRDEIVSVGYSGSNYIVSISNSGVVVKWDITSNITRVFRRLIKGFKALSMACCPHTPLKIAVGTKQGVLLVIDMQGKPKILYKVRGHDDEITSLSWCPLAKAIVHKVAKVNLAQRLEKIRNERTPKSELDEKFGKGKTVKVEEKDANEESNATKENNEKVAEDNEESIVAEDDMFDIYTDHAADEFGHKKFQPEEILVKVQKPTEKSDFLAECLKLKQDILETKIKPEESIHNLVESLEKAAIGKNSNDNKDSESESKEENKNTETINGVNEAGASEKNKIGHDDLNSLSQSYENMLATFDRTGKVCMWTNQGKLIGSSAASSFRAKQTGRPSPCSGLHWPRADLLLLSDMRDNLLECNPLQVDSENKLQLKILHSIHKRSMYCVASGAPKVQSSESDATDYPLWTVGQDRNLVHYSHQKREPLALYATLGGFVYAIAPCPYDAQKLAIGVGDGALRVFSMEEGNSPRAGPATSYWQNVQGKVLTVAWHPTRENLLAFGTAEGRVGLIDVSGGVERPARVLGSPQSRSVYSVCWGERNALYVCSTGRLSVIDTGSSKPAPETIEVEFEGKRWRPTEATWCERGLCVGGADGEVGVLLPRAPHTVLTAAYLFTKQVHCVAWHPQSVTLSGEEAPYKDWLAANAADTHIVVLELREEDGKFKLAEVATIRGHTGHVVRTAWSPHRAGQLLSTSQDSTVRVWSITAAGEVSCTAIYGQHMFSSLSAAWCPQPESAHLVLTGGGDCSLRLWDIGRHPPEIYQDKKAVKHTPFAMAQPEDSPSQEPTKVAAEKKKQPKQRDEYESDEEGDLAKATTKSKPKMSKAYLFPISHWQHTKYTAKACRRLLQRHLKEGAAVGSGASAGGGEGGTEDPEEGMDFLKLFGTQDEFNQLLDQEQERHLSYEHLDKWMILGVMRGEVERVFQMAISRGYMSPFLLTLAPMVSHRFWKDAVQSYMAQLDKQNHEDKQILEEKRNHEEKPNLDEKPNIEDKEKIEVEVKPRHAPTESRRQEFTVSHYLLRKMLLLLSQHNVLGALDLLTECNLYREAYVLARVRHMHEQATALLEKWAAWSYSGGGREVAALCYMVVGKLVEASTVLGKCSDQRLLGLAADIAKCTGQATFADTLVRKREELGQAEDIVKGLPERLALHLQTSQESGDASEKCSEDADTLALSLQTRLSVTDAESGETGEGRDEKESVVDDQCGFLSAYL